MIQLTVLSGGQTGVDLAALYAAEDCGIPYTGWVPLHYTNETGEYGIPERFRSELHETSTTESAERTEKNIRDADGILTLLMEPLGGDDNNDDMNEGASTSNALDISPGTLHGIEHAKKLGKDENQLLFINLAKEDEILDSSEEVHKVVQWLIERNIYKCAIGGPRESEVKGIELKAFHFLKKVFEQYKKENTKQGKTSRAC